MSITKTVVDLVGWAGAITVLGAYACVSFRKIRPDSRWYQFFNALGGLLLVINTAYYRAYPSTFVNVVWITIAVTAWARVKAESSYKRAGIPEN